MGMRSAGGRLINLEPVPASVHSISKVGSLPRRLPMLGKATYVFRQNLLATAAPIPACSEDDMLRKAFETEIIDDGANLIGPWRSPRQMLAEQVYDDHVSIHRRHNGAAVRL